MEDLKEPKHEVVLVGRHDPMLEAVAVLCAQGAPAVLVLDDVQVLGKAIGERLLPEPPPKAAGLNRPRHPGHRITSPFHPDARRAERRWKT